MKELDATTEPSSIGRLMIRAVMGSLLGVLGVLALDLVTRGKGLPEGGWGSIAGFAAVVVSALILAGLAVVLLQPVLGLLGGRRRGFVSMAAFFIPALPLIIRTSGIIFDTPRMQKVAYGGVGPFGVAAALCLGIMIAAAITARFARMRFGRPIAFLGLLAFAAVCRRFDTRFYPGLYPHLHQFAVVALYAVAASAAFLVLPRSGFGGRGALIALVICAGSGFLGYRHLDGFLGSDPVSRRLIGTELQTSSRLWQLLPYRRVDRVEEPAPAGLSPRAQRHWEAREVARKAIAAKKEFQKKWNVLIYSIDAVRFDHTTMGGYARETTPFMAKLAESSVNFTKAR